MIRRPPRSTRKESSAASDVYKRQLLDLDYEEDSAAQVDANFVICDNEKLSEIQVTGEEFFFSADQYQELYKLAQIGINQIISKQKIALE